MGVGVSQGGGHFYIDLPLSVWKRQLVSRPLALGYRLLMLPRPFPPAPPPEAPGAFVLVYLGEGAGAETSRPLCSGGLGAGRQDRPQDLRGPMQRK